MELEIDIEKVFPNVDQPENTAHQNPLMEIIERIPLMKKSLVYFRALFLTMSPKI
jgi:hypothetical protein